MTVDEVRAKFTADMSGYRKALEEAKKPSEEIQQAIQSVGAAMTKASNLSESEMQKVSRALESAGKQATRLGTQAQTLAQQETSLSRSVEEQTAKLAGMQDEYSSTAAEASRLEGVYDGIKKATEGLDLSTPIEQQGKAAEAEISQLEGQISELRALVMSAEADGYTNVQLPNGSITGLAEAKAQLQSLTQQSMQAQDRLADLNGVMQQIGTENLGYASAAGLKSLQDQIGSANGKMAQLELQSAQTESRLTGYGERLETVRARQQTVSQSTEELAGKVQQLSATASPSLGQKISNVFSNMGNSVRNAFSAVQNVLKNGLVGGLKSAASGVVGFAGKLLSLTPGVSILKGIYNRLRGVKSGGEGAGSSLTKMVGSIRNIGIAAIGLKAVRSLFGSLRSVVSEYLSENEAAQTSVDNLKSALSSALAPAINIVINAMNALLPYVQAVSNAFATLVTNLFGSSWTTISGGASSAASAVSDVSDATDDATASQEAYNKTIAGFDEITKLNEESSSSGSGGSSGGTTSSSTDTGSGLLGKFSEFMSQVAALMQGGQWAELGTYLAESFGSAIDTLYGALTSTETYAKIESGVNALATTVNSFFGRLTLIEDDTGTSIAERTGATLGAAVNLAFFTANTTLTSIDWSSIGLTIAQLINGAVGETDFSQIGATIANYFLVLPKILYSTIVNTDWSAVTGGLSDALISGFSTCSSWIESVDWSQIKTAIEEALAGIKWGEIADSLFELIGAALGALGAVVGGLIADAFTNIGQYFDEKTAECGGNVWDGILKGIVDAAVNVATWIDEHIFQPFIKGFKDAFGIASPSTVMAEQGGYIIEGMLNGILDMFTDIGSWIDEHIFQPFTNAFNALFGIDGDSSSEMEASGAALDTGLESGIDSGAGDVTTSVGDLVASISETVGGKWEEIQSATSEAWDTVSGTLGDVWDGISGTASDIWDSVTTTISDAWDDVSTDTETAWEDVESSTTGSSESVEKSIGDSWKSIKSATASVWGDVLTSLKGTFSSMQSSVSSVWSTLGSTISTAWNSIRTATGSVWSSLSSSMQTVWSGMQTNAGKSFSAMKTGIASIMESAKTAVKGAIDKMKSFFNFSWSLPKLKMPHITISGEFSLSPLKVPSFSIDWYKSGGIMDGATIFGASGNTLKVGGEAGAEAILPLESNTGWMDLLAERLVQRMSSYASSGSSSAVQPIQVTVTLDGKVVGQSVVNYAVGQAKATGQLPWAAYT